MVYDCAIDPALWPAALAAVLDSLPFHNVSLSAYALLSASEILAVNVGIPLEWEARIPDYGPDILAMWGGAEQIAGYPLEEPIVLSQVGGEVLHENRYFREWKLPQGSTDSASILLVRDATFFAALTLGRHYSRGAIGPSDLATLRLLAPHFRRAVSIGKLLDFQRLRAETFAATLDALPSAILFVDRGGRIVHVSRAAEPLMSDDTIFTMRRGIPTLHDAAANNQLHAAIALSGTRETALGRLGVAIPTRARTGDAVVIHVLPLHAGGPRGALVRHATAALFIEPSPLSGAVPGEALAVLYNLTPAEAGILELLAEGRTTTKIGALLGIAPSTVKTHLLRLFAKTRCKRQIDLVDLARSFRGPA
jgi:DNA-binding CsgD family transcriptional regulator/PAS domain-containing protein